MLVDLCIYEGLKNAFDGTEKAFVADFIDGDAFSFF